MWRTDLLLPAAVNVLAGLSLLDPGAAAQPAMGAGYGYGGKLERLRAAGGDLSHVDEGSHVFLDYAGTGLYSKSQVAGSYTALTSQLFANPHSLGGTPTGGAIDTAKKLVLSHFNAPSNIMDGESYYSVVLTSSATGAFRLLGESYAFGKGGCFHYLHQNHHSLIGMRTFAKARGATFRGVSFEEVESGAAFAAEDGSECNPATSLFAYPLEDNFEGVKYPKSWVEKFHTEGWAVVVDAAAYAPTNRLDLTEYDADYVAISFYKMFGYPTGVGCLISKKSALKANLRAHEDPKKVTTFFGGGSTLFGSPFDDFCSFRKKQAETPLEDGTVPFLAAASLQYGFVAMAQLGLLQITEHVNVVTEYLYQRLSALKLPDGTAAAVIYGLHGKAPRLPREQERGQGAIVTFNLHSAQLHANGSRGYYGYFDMMEEAMRYGIHLRGGCMCNPGACVLAVTGASGVPRQPVVDYLKKRGSCDDQSDFVQGHPVGALRASLGAYTNKRDIDVLIDFLRVVYVKDEGAGGLKEAAKRLAKQQLQHDDNRQLHYEGKVGGESKLLRSAQDSFSHDPDHKTLSEAQQWWTHFESSVQAGKSEL